jgi:hypothetical protein
MWLTARFGDPINGGDALVRTTLQWSSDYFKEKSVQGKRKIPSRGRGSFKIGGMVFSKRWWRDRHFSWSTPIPQAVLVAA